MIIWDQAGFHLKGEHPLSESGGYLPLQPYSPQLNRVEPLWDIVKREEANESWETLEKL